MLIERSKIVLMKISLKAARVNAGLTQDEAIKALKISKNTLVSYEKYRTSPDINLAKNIAKLYKVEVTDLIFLRNDCALSTLNES